MRTSSGQHLLPYLLVLYFTTLNVIILSQVLALYLVLGRFQPFRRFVIVIITLYSLPHTDSSFVSSDNRHPNSSGPNHYAIVVYMLFPFGPVRKCHRCKDEGLYPYCMVANRYWRRVRLLSQSCIERFTSSSSPFATSTSSPQR